MLWRHDCRLCTVRVRQGAEAEAREHPPTVLLTLRPPFSVTVGKCQYGCPPRGRTSRARCRWIFTSEARRIELRGLIMMAHEVFALMARPSQRSGIESRHIPKMGGAGQAACIPRSTHRIIYIGGNWVRGKGEGVVGEQH